MFSSDHKSSVISSCCDTTSEFSCECKTNTNAFIKITCWWGVCREGDRNLSVSPPVSVSLFTNNPEEFTAEQQVALLKHHHIYRTMCFFAARIISSSVLCLNLCMWNYSWHVLNYCKRCFCRRGAKPLKAELLDWFYLVSVFDEQEL